jgi:hypothetical protein
VKQRQPAVEHPQKTVLELKSKKSRTAMERRFYRAKIAVRKNLTGQQRNRMKADFVDTRAIGL